jgi:Ca2+-binding RTX toxin-like protein
VADLDAKEQLFLELINRARMDPLGEAQRMGLSDLNSGLAPGTISGAPMQVLAGNTYLEASAQAHADDMIARDYFAHNTLGTNATPRDRMVAANYGTAVSFSSGENLAWTGSSGAYDANAAVLVQHKNLFLSAGHRSNILRAAYEDVGVGATVGNYQGLNAMMSAMNYGFDNVQTDVQVTGVHYTDSDNNDFYSIGEGQGGRSVSIFSGATLLGSTSSAAAGGYGIELTTTGQVEVVFAGGNLLANHSVFITLGSDNAKVDLVDGNTIETNFSAVLGQDSVGLRLLGIQAINGTGNALANVLTGNAAANTLDGAGGHDTLLGGLGNDRLIGNAGNDLLQGGDGTDTAVFDGLLSDYLVSYSTATSTFTLRAQDGSIDTVSGVEFFEFGDGTLTALTLQQGAIALQTVNVSTAATAVAEGNLGSKTVSFTITVSAAMATAQTVDYAIAGSGANPANGSDIAGVLAGTLTFAPGETVKMVTISVLGDKVVELNEAFAITLSNPSSQLVVGAGSALVTLSNDDVAPVVITGTALANTLTGTAGFDQMFGLEGHDVLRGSTGDDELSGGDGNDTLDGGVGADAMSGGTGSDIYVVDNILDVLSENGGDGVDTVQSSLTFSLSGNGAVLGDVENLTLTGSAALNGTGNSLNNVLTGNTGANTLTGQDGDDTLNGGGGVDVLIGGIGHDTYVVDNVLDVVDETGSSGTDTIQSTLSFSLAGNGKVLGDVENLVLIGTAAINGTGNGLDNTISGNGGNNIIAGLGGADVLNGGLGVDTASYAASAAGVVVSLMTGLASGGDAEGDTLSGFENLTGSSLDDTLEGNGLNNVLAGGLGLDTISYGNATAGVTVSLALSTAQATVGSGSDTLTGFENLTGSHHGDRLTGSTGANTLSGLDGDDTLNGGAGADQMAGGNGNDIYVVDSVLDVVDETGSSGNDTIQTALTFSLSGNGAVLGDVENLTLTGSAALNGTGNSLNNVLTGNTGANTLTGQDGDDTLNGGGGVDVLIGGIGHDTLTGGAGNDRFHFDDPDFGTDTITDFADGLDKLSFLGSFADSFDDFVVTGNGTNVVVVAFNDDSITLHGVAPITITAADLLFV